MEEASGLTAAHLEAIAGLERRVVAHDGGRLKLEWGVLRQRPPGVANDLLAWDGETLVGFCGIYAFGSEPELSGAVDPAHRREGTGATLLARARSLLASRGCSTLLLVTPRATDAGRRFAQGLGAVLAHSEHHMELDGPPPGPPAARPFTDGLVVRPATDADRAAVSDILSSAFDEAGADVAASLGHGDDALVVEKDGAVVGALRLNMERRTAGIYGFAVRSDLRGRGIGRAALYGACLEARRRGASKVTLEVEVDNDHALGLYTSVGFARRTTEDYFRLSI